MTRYAAIIIEKVTFWTIVNTVYGLAPIWVVWLSKKYLNIGEDCFKIAILDGALTYFCITLVGAVFVDFKLAKIKIGLLSEFIIYFLPVIILGYEIFALLSVQLKGLEACNTEELKQTEIWIVGLTSLYCVGIKSVLFSHELKQSIEMNGSVL